MPLAKWLATHDLAPAGGLGKAHQHHARWAADGATAAPTEPAVFQRLEDGDRHGGHATFPRHPWRAGLYARGVEPPSSPLVGGKADTTAGGKGLDGGSQRAVPFVAADNPHVLAAPTEEQLVDAVELAPVSWRLNGLTDGAGQGLQLLTLAPVPAI